MEILFQDDKVVLKSSDITPRILSNISSVYLRYTKESDISVYSSISNQPISHVYCTTNLDNTLTQEKILIGESKLDYDNDEMIKSKFVFLDKNDENYKEEFAIFNFDNIQSKKLNDKQLKTILYNIFSIYNTVGERLYIVCDEIGDNYNNRSIDILQQIYKRLPYYMRKAVGYNSYTTGDEESGRIKLGITTRSNINLEAENVIILEKEGCSNSTKTISQSIKALVDEIVKLNEDELNDLYEKIYKIYGLKNLRVDKLIRVYDYLNIYKDRELNDELIEDWIYDINRGQGSNQVIDEELDKMLVDDIKSRLDNKSLNNYIRTNFYNTKDLNDIDDYSKSAFEFIYNLEEVTDLCLDTNLISDWLEEKRIPYLKENYKDYELVNMLNKDAELIQNLEQILGFELKNIKVIKEKALKTINRLLYTENIELEKLIKSERDNIKNLFKDTDNSLESLSNTVNKINVEHIENKKILKQEIEKKLLNIMDGYKPCLENIDVGSLNEKQYDEICEQIKLYYKNPKSIILDLFDKNFINKDIKDNLLNGLDIKFNKEYCDIEYIYYSQIINNAKTLDQLDEFFNLSVQKLKYPDANEYKLEVVLNKCFKQKLELLNSGTIDINISELRDFLSKNRNLLEEEILKEGYDYLEKELNKIYVKPCEDENEDVISNPIAVDSEEEIKEESKIDKKTLETVSTTIFKTVNKDINRFFRSLILIQQDIDFSNRLEKVIKNYAQIQNNEHVFLIYDSTLFRTAIQGFVLTQENIYYNSKDEKIGMILIDDVESLTIKGEALFINDIKIDCGIINKDHREEFKKLILSIIYLLQQLHEQNVDMSSVVKEVLCFQD